MDPKKDYECDYGYWEHGRLWPENELAQSTYQAVQLLGSAAITMLKLDKLPESESEVLIERMLVIESLVRQYQKEENEILKKKHKKQQNGQ